jgi:hypothetical protein
LPGYQSRHRGDSLKLRAVSLVTSSHFRSVAGVPESYRVAPIFLIRMAGVPFEVLDPLGTPETAAAARELLVMRIEFTRAKTQVENLLRQRDSRFSDELCRTWRKALRAGTLPEGEDPPMGEFSSYREHADRLATAEARFVDSLQRELVIARQALLTSAQTFLPPYLVFVSESLRERLSKQSVPERSTLSQRRKKDRAHERHLLLYLQRVCAKNDSLSEFGPEGWGTVKKGFLELKPLPGIAERETFVERWAAHGVAAALNADPEIRVEIAPRLNPNGRIDGDQFVFADRAETHPLDQHALDVLHRCDGAAPGYSFGAQIPVLEELAAQGMIHWKVEVPALEPHAFDVLLSDIQRWRDNPVRERWLALLQPIASLPPRFAQARDTTSRAAIMDEARQRLQDLGSARETSDRFLYAASNPIGEECFRECRFSIGEDVIDQVTTEAAPWIDLWRDNYAFVASRVAAGLRTLVEKAPLQNGTIPLPAFLRHCEALRMPLTGPAMVGLAHMAFQEVKAGFRKRMQSRPDTEEWELTTDDCHFIRRDFQYEKFDEFTYPSADLQLEAKSLEAVARGEYQWILAELHPPIALLHHGFYWGCPDKEALDKALDQTTKGHPSFHFGFFAADFTATTAVRMLDALPKRTSFVAPERGNPRWRRIPPAEIEVYVEDKNGDICLRTRGSREYLGSFARAWVIPLGFHPFHFGRAPHMPRLRCGRVIVQRRSWTVTFEELGPGDYTGVSRDLVLAVERLRAEKGWPRFVYIRPSEQALRRSGAEGRDKDTKPVFIDLESYLFLEIFHRWLTKANELEVTEMLPGPDHLFWREEESNGIPAGRRSFELRTQIIPRT